jgi:hypothetical protein
MKIRTAVNDIYDIKMHIIIKKFPVGKRQTLYLLWLDFLLMASWMKGANG